MLTKHGGRGGYAHHPETLRWVGKQKALYNRHELEVKEFFRRGYKHQTPLDEKLATLSGNQRILINSLPEQELC